MKRLIALLAGLAVMSSMTVTSFAAFSNEIVLNEDGTTYTAALTGDAATANAGKQTTIVAYKGDTIEVGSIQYINQDAATSFTFQLKDELTEDVKVVMGGEAIDKQEIGTIFFDKEADTYTVSGTITDPALVAAEIDFSVLESDFDKETADYFRSSWETTVYLVADDAEHTDAFAFLLNYFGEDVEKPTGVVEPVTVDSATGAFAFEGISAGNYTLIVERPGTLPLFSYVTVSDSNVDDIAKTLKNGNVDLDIEIGSGDLNLVVDNAGAEFFEGHENYDPVLDANADFNVGSGDINIIVQNAGADMTSYNEQAILDILAFLE